MIAVESENFENEVEAGPFGPSIVAIQPAPAGFGGQRLTAAKGGAEAGESKTFR